MKVSAQRMIRIESVVSILVSIRATTDIEMTLMVWGSRLALFTRTKDLDELIQVKQEMQAYRDKLAKEFTPISRRLREILTGLLTLLIP